MASGCQSRPLRLQQGCVRQKHERAARFVVRGAAHSVESSVAILKQAAKFKQAKSGEVFQALRELEKAGLQDPAWPAIVGGDRSPGHRWRP